MLSLPQESHEPRENFFYVVAVRQYGLWNFECPKCTESTPGSEVYDSLNATSPVSLGVFGNALSALKVLLLTDIANTHFRWTAASAVATYQKYKDDASVTQYGVFCVPIATSFYRDTLTKMYKSSGESLFLGLDRIYVKDKDSGILNSPGGVIKLFTFSLTDASQNSSPAVENPEDMNQAEDPKTAFVSALKALVNSAGRIAAPAPSAPDSAKIDSIEALAPTSTEVSCPSPSAPDDFAKTNSTETSSSDASASDAKIDDASVLVSTFEHEDYTWTSEVQSSLRQSRESGPSEDDRLLLRVALSNTVRRAQPSPDEHILFMIDASGSMQAFWSTMKATLIAAIKEIYAKSKATERSVYVTMLQFSNSTRISYPFFDDRNFLRIRVDDSFVEKASGIIDKLVVGGSTATLGAFKKLHNDRKQLFPRGSKNSIILLTDGEPCEDIIPRSSPKDISTVMMGGASPWYNSTFDEAPELEGLVQRSDGHRDIQMYMIGIGQIKTSYVMEFAALEINTSPCFVNSQTFASGESKHDLPSNIPTLQNAVTEVLSNVFSSSRTPSFCVELTPASDPSAVFRSRHVTDMKKGGRFTLLFDVRAYAPGMTSGNYTVWLAFQDKRLPVAQFSTDRGVVSGLREMSPGMSFEVFHWNRIEQILQWLPYAGAQPGVKASYLQMIQEGIRDVTADKTHDLVSQTQRNAMKTCYTILQICLTDIRRDDRFLQALNQFFKVLRCALNNPELIESNQDIRALFDRFEGIMLMLSIVPTATWYTGARAGVTAWPSGPATATAGPAPARWPISPFAHGSGGNAGFSAGNAQPLSRVPGWGPAPATAAPAPATAAQAPVRWPTSAWATGQASGGNAGCAGGTGQPLSRVPAWPTAPAPATAATPAPATAAPAPATAAPASAPSTTSTPTAGVMGVGGNAGVAGGTGQPLSKIPEWPSA